MKRKYVIAIEIPEHLDERAICEWEETLFDENDGMAILLSEEIGTAVTIEPYIDESKNEN